MGEDCSESKDKIRFEMNKICRGDKCICEDNFYGDDCVILLNPPVCSSHGSLTLGKCQCDESWVGENCDCNLTCQNNGMCKNNECFCNKA
mmetsp:Transcript_21141/g.17544  ORF Transcript_21141/g.17544 Transcript_21141/m.17544 type:complete len:90 (-) Transcript_21141:2007-2276(-)